MPDTGQQVAAVGERTDVSVSVAFAPACVGPAPPGPRDDTQGSLQLDPSRPVSSATMAP